MISDALLLECKNIARKIAPELHPLYVMRASDCTSWYPRVEAEAGVALFGPCPPGRDQLIEAGLWVGPGPIILLVNEDLSRLATIATFVHELAHCLPPTTFVDVVSTPENRAEYASQLQHFDTVGEGEPGTPAWFPNHGLHFMRMAIHCWWRLSLRCEIVVPVNCLMDLIYDLSSLSWYWLALGNEPLKMKDELFSTIAATPITPAFSGLFQDDMRLWQERNPEASKTLLEKSA